MRSLCVKSNNEDVLSFFMEKLISLNLDSLYVSRNHFTFYENVIVHYISSDLDFFYDKFSSVLTDTIIHFYENKLLKRTLEYNYFYFSPSERNKILDISKDFLESDDIVKEDNYFSIFNSVLDYIKENKSLILDGFVNFRLPDYVKSLDYVVDIGVNKFLIEKEYNEFIDILKTYISFTPPKIPVVHLIYNHGESILLDNNKNLLPINNDIFEGKYLSDITFSSNDYALNTLLSNTPKKLIIHLIDDNSDEFINTLKLIFADRIEITNKYVEFV